MAGHSHLDPYKTSMLNMGYCMKVVVWTPRYKMGELSANIATY